MFETAYRNFLLYLAEMLESQLEKLGHLLQATDTKMYSRFFTTYSNVLTVMYLCLFHIVDLFQRKRTGQKLVFIGRSWGGGRVAGGYGMFYNGVIFSIIPFLNPCKEYSNIIACENVPVKHNKITTKNKY